MLNLIQDALHPYLFQVNYCFNKSNNLKRVQNGKEYLLLIRRNTLVQSDRVGLLCLGLVTTVLSYVEDSEEWITKEAHMNSTALMELNNSTTQSLRAIQPWAKSVSSTNTTIWKLKLLVNKRKKEQSNFGIKLSGRTQSFSLKLRKKTLTWVLPVTINILPLSLKKSKNSNLLTKWLNQVVNAPLNLIS